MAKILIAEDDKFLSQALSVKFKKSGFEVETALNGQQALTKISEYCPDVLLLDLMMPVVDGFEVLEKLQQQANKIPIIVSSNLSQKEDFDRAINLGAKDFIIKSSISLDQIVTKVKSFL